MGRAVDKIITLTLVKAHLEHTATGRIVAVREHNDSRRFATRVDDARLGQGQTRSNFIHPVTGHAMGKSEIGDTYEHLFAKHGADMVAKHEHTSDYHMIAGGENDHGTRGSRTTPLDFRLDGTHGGEVKTLSASSANQKTAIKAEEVARKQEAVKKMGVKPLLVAQVVDQKKKEVHVYVHHEFASKAVARMEHVGSYKYSDKDFEEAQRKTGHWDKKEARAKAQQPIPEEKIEKGDTVIETRQHHPHVYTKR